MTQKKLTLTRNKLFSVIRSGMELEMPETELTREECLALIDVGGTQSILPIIYNGLKRMHAEDEILNAAEEATHTDLYDYVLNCGYLDKICKSLDNAQVPYILLKGAVIRQLYPSPYMRTSGDIDILVHEEDLEKAVGAIEADTDFKALERVYHDVPMVNDYVHLELHFTIRENNENIDPLLDRAWEYAKPSGKGCGYVFTPEYQIFHVIAHMCHHFLKGGLGIRPFIDLWLLKNRTEYDDEIVRKMCSESNILKFYEECCNMSEVWLENKDRSETSKLLETFCLSGGVFGSDRFQYAARQRNKRGLKYVLSRAFPPAYQVKEYYRDETGKKHLLPYYYAKRLQSWFSKERRAELNKQIDGLVGSDKEYLAQTDRLFKMLELTE